MEDLSKLDLEKLWDLKEKYSWLTEKYSKMLTDYATMNNDAGFTRINNVHRDIMDKRIKTRTYLENIERCIELKLLDDMKK